MRQHIERHVTTKLREVAYARLVPTSTPQNGNILSLKYLVKLIGLNVLLGQNTLKLDGSNWREKIRNGESVGKIEAT
ncbi:4930_t:CDS:2 [Rhizophagus irregularis]|nr:4930_t:CDS:2 [Rhizophagus irregularis]